MYHLLHSYLSFLHLARWNAAVIAGILAAILDHEDKIVEQRARRSLGLSGLCKTSIPAADCLPQDFMREMDFSLLLSGNSYWCGLTQGPREHFTGVS